MGTLRFAHPTEGGLFLTRKTQTCEEKTHHEKEKNRVMGRMGKGACDVPIINDTTVV